MAQTYKSRTGKTPYPAEQVYTFLSDFRNFEHLIPEDKVGSWQTDGETCSFDLPGVGRVGLEYIEKTPHSRIRISGDSSAKIPFTLEIVLREEEGATQVELMLEASLNVFIRALAEKPLKEFLEIMVSHIESFDFSSGQPAE
jgi:carbon monoxide dehydrogenase subunit G